MEPLAIKHLGQVCEKCDKQALIGKVMFYQHRQAQECGRGVAKLQTEDMCCEEPGPLPRIVLASSL